MEIVPNISASPFDAIKQVNSQGVEFWSARDLMPMLGYDRWENFDASIERALIMRLVETGQRDGRRIIQSQRAGPLMTTCTAPRVPGPVLPYD